VLKSKKAATLFLWVFLLVFFLASCGGTAAAPKVTAVSQSPTVPPPTATELQPTETAVSTSTPEPPTPTSEATATPVPPTPTDEPTPTARPPLSGSGGGVIAYTSEASGKPGIYIMNADGTDQRQLTEAYDAHPSWSPDGKKIAFSTRPLNVVAIAVVDVESKEVRQLTDTDRAPGAPDWSPDGRTLAIIYNPAHPGIDFELFTMNAAGGGFKQLTDSAGYQYFENPDWSPDGSKLVYGADLAGNSDIYVADPNGANQLQLTFDEAADRSPAWSPDGSQIAFETNRDGNWEIYLMNADGSGLVNISNHENRDQWPSWSPDGTRIAFQSYRDGNWEIYMMNADGTQQQRLTQNEVKDIEPAWRP
jgi:Tol biopolymer transport system component